MNQSNYFDRDFLQDLRSQVSLHAWASVVASQDYAWLTIHLSDLPWSSADRPHQRNIYATAWRVALSGRLTPEKAALLLLNHNMRPPGYDTTYNCPLCGLHYSNGARCWRCGNNSGKEVVVLEERRHFISDLPDSFDIDAAVEAANI